VDCADVDCADVDCADVAGGVDGAALPPWPFVVDGPHAATAPHARSVHAISAARIRKSP